MYTPCTGCLRASEETMSRSVGGTERAGGTERECEAPAESSPLDRLDRSSLIVFMLSPPLNRDHILFNSPVMENGRTKQNGWLIGVQNRTGERQNGRATLLRSLGGPAIERPQAMQANSRPWKSSAGASPHPCKHVFVFIDFAQPIHCSGG